MSVRPMLPAHLQTGDAESFALGIDELALFDGSTLKLPTPGVTAVVGANNSGKSTLLREIHWALTREIGAEPHHFLLLKTLRTVRDGSSPDMIAWLARHVTLVPSSRHATSSIGFRALTQSNGEDPQFLQDLWERLRSNPDRLDLFHHYFVHYLNTEARLGLTAPQQQRNIFTDPPMHPLHHLQDDPELLRTLQELSKRLFRQTLTLDRLSGNVRLLVGEPSVAAPAIDAVSPEYQRSLAELPGLADQGDGMKSLLGLLLPLITATRPILIIDEPEAFLHPPQANALGKVLGELAANNRLQVILATHDRNLLTGLLQSSAEVSVVRLNRREKTTRAHQLDSAALREVWNDPVLRYSNVLDGLFHRLVVLAEADPDCRFYAAALEHADNATSLPLALSDVLFVPSGGKDGLPKLAKALRAVQVPVVASPDLDILNDELKLRTLVSAFHGDWSTLERDYKVATNPFRHPKAPRSVQTVLDAINGALKEHASERYNADHHRLVQGELYVASPFSELKSKGEAAFPHGEAASAAGRLLDGLEAIGIVAVRVGELEGFAPRLEVAKGPAWLPAALEAGAHQHSAAQDHLRRILQVHAQTL